MNRAAVAAASHAVRVLQQTGLSDGQEMVLTVERVAALLVQLRGDEVGWLRAAILSSAGEFLQQVARELRLAGNDVRGYVGLPPIGPPTWADDRPRE